MAKTSKPGNIVNLYWVTTDVALDVNIEAFFAVGVLRETRIRVRRARWPPISRVCCRGPAA